MDTMLLLLLPMLFSVLAREAEQRPSPGCTRSLVPAAGLHQRYITVADFEPIKRTYWIDIPEGLSRTAQSKSSPLILAIHGQGGTGKDFAAWHKFAEIGRSEGLIAVFPQGMNDSYPGEEQGTGWNVGSAGDNQTCELKGVGTYYGCYTSCRKLQQCGRCNWSTCYDDVLFVSNVIEAVAEEFCVDLDRIYAQGESNGAELVHHLVRELPATFAGISTWYGTPLLGYLLGKNMQLIRGHTELSRTAVLALHGRNDTTIPPEGGVTDGGWLFEPLRQSTGVWSYVHQCDQTAKPLSTRWDGGPLNFRCMEHQSCSSGRQVVECMYDGQHGDWPVGDAGDEITLWFLLRFSRGSHSQYQDAAVEHEHEQPTNIIYLM